MSIKIFKYALFGALIISTLIITIQCARQDNEQDMKMQYNPDIE